MLHHFQHLRILRSALRVAGTRRTSPLRQEVRIGACGTFGSHHSHRLQVQKEKSRSLGRQCISFLFIGVLRKCRSRMGSTPRDWADWGEIIEAAGGRTNIKAHPSPIIFKQNHICSIIIVAFESSPTEIFARTQIVFQTNHFLNIGPRLRPYTFRGISHFSRATRASLRATIYSAISSLRCNFPNYPFLRFSRCFINTCCWSMGPMKKMCKKRNHTRVIRFVDHLMLNISLKSWISTK